MEMINGLNQRRNRLHDLNLPSDLDFARNKLKYFTGKRKNTIHRTTARGIRFLESLENREGFRRYAARDLDALGFPELGLTGALGFSFWHKMRILF